MLRLSLLTLFVSLTLSSFCQRKDSLSVYFSFDKSSLSAKSSGILDSFFKALPTPSEYVLTIKGYADEIGTQEYNSRLAQQRSDAVFNYLSAKRIALNNVAFKGEGDDMPEKNLPNYLKRKVTITIEQQAQQPPQQQTFTYSGTYGTTVTSPYPVDIKEYYTSASMLANSMYAIDVNGRILETAGMLRLCLDNTPTDPTGKYFLIRMPARGGFIDTSMKVWNAVTDKNGQVRWQLTPVKFEKLSKDFYMFYYPVPQSKCLLLNCDKLVELVQLVYVSTNKPYRFKDVRVKENQNSLVFSAKLNDTSYVFVNSVSTATSGMTFTGVSDNSAAGLSVPLADCIYTVVKSSEHYYICDSCIDKKVVAAPQPVAEPPKLKKKRRGFFAWLADLFRSK